MQSASKTQRLSLLLLIINLPSSSGWATWHLDMAIMRAAVVVELSTGHALRATTMQLSRYSECSNKGIQTEQHR